MKKETEHGSKRKQAEKPRWDNWHVRLPNPKDRDSRYLVGKGIYFGKPKKKETFIYNSS